MPRNDKERRRRYYQERKEKYREYYRLRHIRLKEKIQAYQKEYREKNRKRINERRRENSKLRRTKNKSSFIKWKYGITIDEYNVLFEKQGGVCAICGNPETARNRSLHIDHDHKTGRVRGLLCHQCNLAIGLVRDDPSILQKIADYLVYHKSLR